MMDAREIRRLRIERISKARACEHELVNHKLFRAIKDIRKLQKQQQDEEEGTTGLLRHSKRLQQKLEAAAEEQNLERVRRTIAEREAWANQYRRYELKNGVLGSQH